MPEDVKPRCAPETVRSCQRQTDTINIKRKGIWSRSVRSYSCHNTAGGVYIMTSSTCASFDQSWVGYPSGVIIFNHVSKSPVDLCWEGIERRYKCDVSNVEKIPRFACDISQHFSVQYSMHVQDYIVCEQTPHVTTHSIPQAQVNPTSSTQFTHNIAMRSDFLKILQSRVFTTGGGS